MPKLPRTLEEWKNLSIDDQRLVSEHLRGQGFNTDGDVGIRTAISAYDRRLKDEVSPLKEQEYSSVLPVKEKPLPSATPGEKSYYRPTSSNESPATEQERPVIPFESGAPKTGIENLRKTLPGLDGTERTKAEKYGIEPMNKGLDTSPPSMKDAADEGLNPLSAFEQYAPVKDVEREARLKKAAAFRTMGMALGDIVDLVGGQGWLGNGYKSVTSQKQDTATLRILAKIEKDRQLYEGRLDRWRNNMMGIEDRVNRRERYFEQQKEIQAGANVNRMDLAKFNYKQKKALDDYATANDAKLKAIQYGFSKALQDDDNAAALQLMKEKNRHIEQIQLFKDANSGKYLMLYDDNMNPVAQVDNSQMKKLFALILKESDRRKGMGKDGVTSDDFDLLKAGFNAVSREQQQVLVSKYWDYVRDVIVPDVVVPEGSENSSGYIKPYM